MRHLRLGPGAAAAWLSSSLLPLWVTDLIFGLKMGLWQVKAAAGDGGGREGAPAAAGEGKEPRGGSGQAAKIGAAAPGGGHTNNNVKH
jgi:hypothetical protein